MAAVLRALTSAARAACSFKCGGGGREQIGEAGFFGFEAIRALKRCKLFVFQPRDTLFGEGDFVLQRGDLRGGGGSLHLLAQASEFVAVLSGVCLLRVAQHQFFGERVFGRGESDFGLGAGGLRSGDADRRIRKLRAKALEFEVLGLENDEVFEVRVHKGTSSSG